MKNLIKRTRTPLDTNIVFMHRLMIAVMLTLFAYSKYAQMERQSPSCSGSGMINLTHERKLKVCITTAAFVEYQGEKRYTNGLGLSLPTILFIMAVIYVIPLRHKNYYENENLLGLFEKASTLPWEDAVRNIDVVIMYSKGILSRRVRLSWECLEADLGCLLLLDMISSTNLLTELIVGGLTHGWDYVIDQWALVYPTNVKCEIGPQMVYVAINTEHYGCIIPHNEILKPIWMVTSIIVIFSALLSFISFVYHIIQMLPFQRKHFFQGTGVKLDGKVLERLRSNIPGGDDGIFLLKAYLLQLPSKEVRRAVVTELLTMIKENE